MLFNCPDASPNFLGLFDLKIAPPLLFYSYLPIILVSLFFGFFIFFKSRFSTNGKNLLYIAIAFSVFLLNEIVQWVAAPMVLVAYGWALAPLFQMFVWLSVINFFCAFLQNQPLPLKWRILIAAFCLPILLFLPTKFNISSFDFNNCEGVVGPLWYYLYAFQVLSILFLLILGIKKYREVSSKEFKSQVLLLLIGVFCFLSIFSASSIFGEVFKTYEINLVGPIGMAVFIGLLTHIIVKFKAFSIKLLGAQALAVAMIILTGSQLFFIQTLANRVSTAIIFVVSIFFGWLLVKGVSRDIKQKEQLNQYATELQGFNKTLEAKVVARTAELQKAFNEIKTRKDELERFYHLTVGRELKMVELKKRIKELEKPS